MRICVNGVDRDVPQGTTVAGLLQEMRLSPNRVAVEVNKRLLKMDRYGESLNEGDQVEIVTLVGGG